MMHTEKEARKLWCPMVRYHDGSSPFPYNRGAETYHRDMECCGSRCMMWRWGEERTITEQCYDGSAIVYPEKVGYCGLGGKP